MDDITTRFVTEMIGRIDGPMSLRVFIQPCMAAYFAFRDGRKDASEGQTPYGWALFTRPEHRAFLLHDGWKGFGRVFLISIVLDLVYQYAAIGGFRPLQAVATAFFLAMVPYVLLRGPFNRLLTWRRDSALRRGHRDVRP
jgi:hypothetical protein